MKAKGRAALHTARCDECGREFEYDPALHDGDVAAICGRLECRMAGMTDAEWQGKARMALARRDAGLVLTTTDLQALARVS